MSLSYREIQEVVESLQKELFSTKGPEGFVSLQKVYERDSNTVVLQLRANRQSYFLLLSSTDRLTRIYAVETKPRQPKTPTAFTMALRKYVIGAFHEITLSKNDRVITLDFGTAKIIAELSNIHASLILVDAENKVISATNFGQRIRPGCEYKPRTEPEDNSTTFFTGKTKTRFETLDDLRDHYEAFTTATEAQAIRTVISKGIKRKKKHLQKIVAKLNGELLRSEEAEHFQKWGTLLQSKIGQVPRGTEIVDVVDYYQEKLPTIQIEIDKKKSLQENIERFFHQYKRLTGAVDRILGRIDKIEKELAIVSALEIKLVKTTTIEDLEKLFKEAKKQKILKAKQKKQNAKTKEARVPYRTYLSGSGVEIWVGRSSKDNDILSLKLAKGNDVWLHARDWQGSHVLLRTTIAKLKSEDLIDAAMLALHFSKGKNDSGAEITYTSAKHIKKPKGAPHGLVSVASGKSIAVRLDPLRLEKLLATLKA